MFRSRCAHQMLDNYESATKSATDESCCDDFGRHRDAEITSGLFNDRTRNKVNQDTALTDEDDCRNFVKVLQLLQSMSEGLAPCPPSLTQPQQPRTGKAPQLK